MRSRSQSGTCFKGVPAEDMSLTFLLLSCFQVWLFNQIKEPPNLIASVVSCLQPFLSLMLVFTTYPSYFLAGQISKRSKRDAQGSWAGTSRGREKSRVVWPCRYRCMARRRGSPVLCLSQVSFHYTFSFIWQRCFPTAQSPEKCPNFLKMLLSLVTETVLFGFGCFLQTFS